MSKSITVITALLVGVNSFENEPAGWEPPAHLVNNEKRGMNYDESKGPPYKLPELLNDAAAL